MNILIADDNTQITSILSEYAKQEGYKPLVALDGLEAYNLFLNQEIDFVLLDVMMPNMDGFEVCRNIRKQSTVPIIMITARSEDFERIMGLDIGADDYIVKPFSPKEVMARIRCILRRTSNLQHQLLCIDNLCIDYNAYKVSIDQQDVELTKKEFELLWLFASNPMRVYDRETLLNQLWGYDYFGDARSVDSHIKRLRRKLDNHVHTSWTIKTIWGVGYRFEMVESNET